MTLRAPVEVDLPEGIDPSELEQSELDKVVTYAQQSPDGSWEVVPASWDPATGLATAEVEHFDWWNPFSWSFAGDISQGAGELFGTRRSSPSCEDPDRPAWVNEVVFDDFPTAVIKACTEVDGDQDEILVIRLVNNRPYGQLLSSSQPLAWTRVTEQGLAASISSGVTSLAGDVFDGAAKDSLLYLPPLSEAAVGISRPATGGPLTVELTATVNTLSLAVEVVLDVLYQTVGKTGIIADLAVLLLRCGTLDPLIGGISDRVSMAPDDLGSLVTTVGGCFARYRDDQALTELVDTWLRSNPGDGQLFRQLFRAGSLLRAVEVGRYVNKLLDLGVDTQLFFGDASVLVLAKRPGSTVTTPVGPIRLIPRPTDGQCSNLEQFPFDRIPGLDTTGWGNRDYGVTVYGFEPETRSIDFAFSAGFGFYVIRDGALIATLEGPGRLETFDALYIDRPDEPELPDVIPELVVGGGDAGGGIYPDQRFKVLNCQFAESDLTEMGGF